MKGHQTQGEGPTWKLDVELNNFCDNKVETGRTAQQDMETDPVYPDQNYGFRWGETFTWGPRDAIMLDSQAEDLK